MFNLKLTAALLMLPCVALADAYLCVPEAGGVVHSGGPKGISADILNVNRDKWVMTNESGKWIVKALGSDAALFDKCESEFFCENASGFAGAFWRDQQGVFSIVWLLVDGEVNHLASAKGKCSKV